MSLDYGERTHAIDLSRHPEEVVFHANVTSNSSKQNFMRLIATINQINFNKMCDTRECKKSEDGHSEILQSTSRTTLTESIHKVCPDSHGIGKTDSFSDPLGIQFYLVDGVTECSLSQYLEVNLLAALFQEMRCNFELYLPDNVDWQPHSPNTYIFPDGSVYEMKLQKRLTLPQYDSKTEDIE